MLFPFIAFYVLVFVPVDTMPRGAADHDQDAVAITCDNDGDAAVQPVMLNGGVFDASAIGNDAPLAPCDGDGPDPDHIAASISGHNTVDCAVVAVAVAGDDTVEGAAAAADIDNWATSERHRFETWRRCWHLERGTRTAHLEYTDKRCAVTGEQLIDCLVLDAGSFLGRALLAWDGTDDDLRLLEEYTFTYAIHFLDQAVPAHVCSAACAACDPNDNDDLVGHDAPNSSSDDGRSDHGVIAADPDVSFSDHSIMPDEVDSSGTDTHSSMPDLVEPNLPLLDLHLRPLPEYE